MRLIASGLVLGIAALASGCTTVGTEELISTGAMALEVSGHTVTLRGFHAIAEMRISDGRQETPQGAAERVAQAQCRSYVVTKIDDLQGRYVGVTFFCLSGPVPPNTTFPKLP